MPSRRALLVTVLATLPAAVTLAGCAESRSGGPSGSPSPSPDETTTATAGASNGTATDEGSPTATTTALDLREANVTGVAVSPAGDGYRFDVTLHHDDDGEAGYANWWQVESLDGERLGRRELLHPHGTREFTRSATVSVPAGTPCVVVRGHDETHGYGGRAALAVPDAGRVQFVEQGPDPRAFAAGDCP